MNAVYARQSIDKKDSLSIDGQIELCKKYAGNDVLLFIDKGFSGKNTNRPEFRQLLLAIEEGKIKKLYCYRLDRISRSISDFGKIWELLEQNNVEFQSVTENFDTSSPMGRAMLNIVMTFAQLERETTAERVKDNYIHRFSLGAWPGGPAPYGFNLHKVTGSSGKTESSLVINPEQAGVVKRIFENYAEDGASLRSVAKELGADQIHGPKREAWDNVTLSRILHSPVYVRADEDIYWHYVSLGLHIPNAVSDFDGVHACNIIGQRIRSKNKYNAPEGQRLAVSNHEGFIDPGLWLKVQEKLSKNRQISQDNAGKYSWLTGLLKCACCGYAVKINYNKANNRLYLICSGKSNLNICNTKISLNIRELEKAVEEHICKVIEECSPEELDMINAEKAREILDIELKIERLVNALAESSEVSAAYISKLIEKLHRKHEKLLSQRASKTSRLKKINFRKASFEEKKLIAGQFIDKILLGGETAEIIWKM